MMDHMSIHEVVGFALVSREARERVASYLRRRFRLYEALKPFMAAENFESFRALMARCQMVISGSVALQFFSRIVWPESDMDLYVDERFASIVATWFNEEEYTLIAGSLISLRRHRPADFRDGEPNSGLEFDPATFGGYAGVRTVMTYRYKVTGRIVQVVSCGGTPVQTIIKFHSSTSVLLFFPSFYILFLAYTYIFVFLFLFLFYFIF